MSRWFRHYAGMMRDEKLVSVAVRSKQTVERVVWVWGAILESAAEINDGGRYDFDAGEAAYFLRCDEDELAGIIGGLQSLGRIDNGVIAKWSDRQFDSDGSKERQRRYRERQKGLGNVQERVGDAGNRKSDVTKTSRDGDVTLQETDTELPDATASGSPEDPREILWSHGVAYVKAKTGKTEAAAKSMIGKWLKDTEDDCALVLSKIRIARAERIGEPIAWITAALKPPDKQERKPRNAGELARMQIKAMQDAPDNETRHFLQSDRNADHSGTGIARRFALPAGG